VLLFKTAFVREFTHSAAFFRTAALPLTALLAVTKGQLFRPLFGIWLSVIVCGLLVTPANLGNPFSRIAKYAHDAVSTPEQYQPISMSSELSQHLDGKTVDVYPYDLSIAFAQNVIYRPRPIPQSYAAYTPMLDELNEAAVRSSNYAEYVLLHFDTVDYRYFLFEEPRTYRALAEHYRSEGVFGRWLLMRRALKRVSRDNVLLRSTGRMNDSIAIPQSTQLLFGCFTIDYTLLGSLATAIYRPPELRVIFELESGVERSYRAIRPLLQSCVPINYHVDSLRDLEAFLSNDLGRLMKVKAIRFSSYGDYAYQPQIAYVVKEREVSG